jgi:glycosyltransferase involved in cell wall biosynthesis
MSSLPQISVILPVHNGMPYLPLTVDSILGQSLTDFELLALDDGSTDETPDYLKSQSDSRIRYHRLERLGLVGALNYALGAAQADLVARIDADDVARLDRLEKQHAHLAENPECVAVGCQCDCIDAGGKPAGRREFPTADGAIRWTMLFRSPILHPGSMYRRQDAIEAGGYSQEFDVAEDYDLWARLAGRGALANCPETLLDYRIHDKAVSSVHQKRQVEQASRIAAGYASRLNAAFDTRAFADLYLFLADNRVPPTGSMESLIDAFLAARDHFVAGMKENGAELKDAIRQTQRNLRWLCVHHAEGSAWRLLSALSWLRTGARFDPEDGGVVKSLSRGIRKWFQRSPAQKAKADYA